MRGPSRTVLVQAEDSAYYVVKLREDQRGPRILINEYIASSIFQELGIATPVPAFVEIPETFLTSPGMKAALEKRRITAGLHFGSRFPGVPDRAAVWDVLPATLMPRVVNLNHLTGALLVDRWLGKTDRRHAIFFRVAADVPSLCLLKGDRGEALQGSERYFVCQMVDNKSIFGGERWEFQDIGQSGPVYTDHCTDSRQSSVEVELWKHKIRNFSEGTLHRLRSQVPSQWVKGHEKALESLQADLLKRAGEMDAVTTSGRKPIAVVPSATLRNDSC
ncbi:MAG: HipA family kinase [Bacteroidota bacterium]